MRAEVQVQQAQVEGWLQQAPELPGKVTALSVDYWTWAALLLSAVVFLAWLFGALLSFWSQRRQQRAAYQQKEKHILPSSSLDKLQQLQSSLHTMSTTQRVEAEQLSWLLREECGKRIGCDCQSATDTELLQLISVWQERTLLNCAPTDFASFLSFTTSILYVQQPASVASWQLMLDEIAAWVESSAQQVEGSV